MMRLFVAACVLSLSCSLAIAEVRELELRFLSPNEASELISPLLSTSEGVSAVSGRLFLDSDAKTYREMKRLLQAVDIEPILIRVTVRRGGKMNVHGASSQPVKPGGWAKHDLVAGSVSFIETGHGLSALGVEPRRAYGATSISPTAELGKRGFFLMARVFGDEVVVRTSKETMTPRWDGQPSPEEMELVYSATGQQGTWISVGPRPKKPAHKKVEVKKGGAQADWQVRIERL